MNYWENRYREGGTSGNGSVGRVAIDKWNAIAKFVNLTTVKTILDMGCGDTSFWNRRPTYIKANYTGLDQSETVIANNRKSASPFETFEVQNIAVANLNYMDFDLVMCLDVLFHVIDGSDFEDIICNASNYLNDNGILIIYTWKIDPTTKPSLYQKIRLFLHLDTIYQKFRSQDVLLSTAKKYGLYLAGNSDIQSDDIGRLYVFRKLH